MDVRVGEQRLDGLIGFDLAAVLGAERGGIERTTCAWLVLLMASMWAVAAQP
jgi:hypothetical protein